ncbi:Postacrosomal sheath WW domain-binding protein [Geodia barretti]|uniref:Postacrosomal sheath WW domain-binding protein n=1 Tax=Geodia barretti TaxID=519541 RepID=A0AA35QV79_GEOBA|nr:Postacrosomal sheath WW domain-binding protein [Geodia barretti]
MRKPNKMAERALLTVEGVSIQLSAPAQVVGETCAVELRNEQLDLVNGETRTSLPFTVIKHIDLHQPIFGANYIVGEYEDGGRRRSFTLTFRRGGATDFTRLFFRLAAGELQQDDSTSAPPVNIEPPQDTRDDKKNR